MRTLLGGHPASIAAPHCVLRAGAGRGPGTSRLWGTTGGRASTAMQYQGPCRQSCAVPGGHAGTAVQHGGPCARARLALRCPGCSCRRNRVSAQAGVSSMGQAPSSNSLTQPGCHGRLSRFRAQTYQLSAISGLFLNFMYVGNLALRGSHAECVRTRMC